jgi:hypothetical protein
VGGVRAWLLGVATGVGADVAGSGISRWAREKGK